MLSDTYLFELGVRPTSICKLFTEEIHEESLHIFNIQLIKPRILTGMYTEHSSRLRSEVNLNRGDISTWAEEEKYLNRLLLQNTHCWNSMNANFGSKAFVLFIIVKVHHISNLLHSATIFKSSIMYYVSPKKKYEKEVLVILCHKLKMVSSLLLKSNYLNFTVFL